APVRAQQAHHGYRAARRFAFVGHSSVETRRSVTKEACSDHPGAPTSAPIGNNDRCPDTYLSRPPSPCVSLPGATASSGSSSPTASLDPPPLPLAAPAAGSLSSRFSSYPDALALALNSDTTSSTRSNSATGSAFSAAPSSDGNAIHASSSSVAS